MKKYLRYSIVFLVALLFLGACGKKEESSSEVMDQIDIANSLETDNFDVLLGRLNICLVRCPYLEPLILVIMVRPLL